MDEEVIEEYRYQPNRVKLDAELKTDVEWCSLNLCKPIMRALNAMGYKAPTPIQRDVIPEALAGQDILAMSHTGSGKTAAFLVPCIQRLAMAPMIRRRKLLSTSTGAKSNKIITNSGQCITKVLVLLPTRELAAQCFGVCNELTQFLPITSALLLGGGSMEDQERKAKACPDILICTPGRCLDVLLNTQSVHLDLLDILVFDEADKLIELGFKDVCESIIKRCSPTRQTMMFSATLTSQADELSKHCLNPKPVVIKGILKNEKAVVPTQLQFKFIELENDDQRLPALIKVLRERKTHGRVIVFFNTKLNTRKTAAVLRHVNEKVFEMHGNLSHNERVRAISGFQEEGGILLCTDLIARGIDIHDVETVVHLELPLPPEGSTVGSVNVNKPHEWLVKFIHRSGRTGRGGSKGDVISFYIDSEYKVVKHIKQMLSKSGISDSDAIKWNSGILEEHIVPEATSLIREQIKLDKAEKEIRQAEKQLHKLQKFTTEDEETLENLKVKRQWIKRRQDNLINKVQKDVKKTGIIKKATVEQASQKAKRRTSTASTKAKKRTPTASTKAKKRTPTAKGKRSGR